MTTDVSFSICIHFPSMQAEIIQNTGLVKPWLLYQNTMHIIAGLSVLLLVVLNMSIQVTRANPAPLPDICDMQVTYLTTLVHISKKDQLFEIENAQLLTFFCLFLM